MTSAKQSTLVTKLSRGLAVALAATFLSVGTGGAVTGCGGDEPAAKKPGGGGKRRARRSGRRGGGGGKGKRGKSVERYDKVADEMRHKFTESDFRVDIGGDENRDPFRSYVVRNRGDRIKRGGGTIEETEICGKDNSVAVSFALRDLRLRGIVLRGTKSYALFVDSSQLGHIVRRGDCLGKDKARVDAIGAGFVRLTVTPEAPPGAPAPAPQTRDISLYPEEVSLDPTSEGEAP